MLTVVVPPPRTSWGNTPFFRNPPRSPSPSLASAPPLSTGRSSNTQVAATSLQAWGEVTSALKLLFSTGRSSNTQFAGNSVYSQARFRYLQKTESAREPYLSKWTAQRANHGSPTTTPLQSRRHHVSSAATKCIEE